MKMTCPLNVMFMLFVFVSWGYLSGITESHAQEKGAKVALFDGTFSGWEGDTASVWRIENDTIVAGSMDSPARRNEFLCSKSKYSDFELTLEFKTNGTKKINAGVQFRTQLMREKHASKAQQYNEVVGYQADIGDGYHGCLYDESRRRKVLSRPDEVTNKKVTDAVAEDGWQTYRIRAVGDHVELWLNGVKTVDFTETDGSIWREGIIALQIHGGMVGTIAYRNIKIKDLSATKAAPVSIDEMSWIAGHWTGEALGGQFEETWNPPLGGEMIGMFKLVKDGKVVFYELLTIVERDDSFVLRLKHFDEKLVGWEEKEKSIEFPFVSASPTELKFNGLTFSRLSRFTTGAMEIEVVVDQGGKQEKLVFDCIRKNAESK